MKLIKSDIDSSILGKRVCKVKLNKITPGILKSIHEKVIKQNYAVAFITSETINLPDLGNFPWKGLVFSEFKLILKHKLVPVETPVHPDFYVNTAYKDEDLAVIYSLITGLYNTSRFYHDKLLPRTFSKKVFHQWAEESLAGNWADTIYYVRSKSNDEIAGLITSKKRSADLVQSVLVVVDPSYQGKGLGKFLMSFVHSDYFKNGFKESLIATQYNNKNALIYYAKTGYYFDTMIAELHLYNNKYRKS